MLQIVKLKNIMYVYMDLVCVNFLIVYKVLLVKI